MNCYHDFRQIFPSEKGFGAGNEACGPGISVRIAFWNRINILCQEDEPDFVKVSLRQVVPGNSPVFATKTTGEQRTYLPLNPLLGMGVSFYQNWVRISEPEKLQALLRSYVVPPDRLRVGDWKVLPLASCTRVAKTLAESGIPHMFTDDGLVLVESPTEAR